MILMTEAPVVYCPECHQPQPHVYITRDGGIANRFTSDRLDWYVCHFCEATIIPVKHAEANDEGEQVKTPV